MNSDDRILAVIRALHELGAPYMVVGSLSSNVYGIPRSTQDAAFVLQSPAEHIHALARKLGPSFVLDSQTSFDPVGGSTRYVFQTTPDLFGIEVFKLGEDLHDQERFRRRKQLAVLGLPAWIPTAEDVIITKLRWLLALGRSKDEDDVRGVLSVQGEALDEAYLHSWCDLHGTRGLLDRLRLCLP